MMPLKAPHFNLFLLFIGHDSEENTKNTKYLYGFMHHNTTSYDYMHLIEEKIRIKLANYISTRFEHSQEIKVRS